MPKASMKAENLENSKIEMDENEWKSDSVDQNLNFINTKPVIILLTVQIDVQSQSIIEDVQDGYGQTNSDRRRPDRRRKPRWMLTRDEFIVKDEDEDGAEEESVRSLTSSR
ncbi:hypothetical protein F511_30338 [Dorcoceras hygrometricum]|uniref:Uncharacterized protein n=1 Tax=Dorcoceras hygrometricum TaxID=472368 RepID=A0A2Z7DCR7_9LAMI|nr:hypothetical protein F511_30338 [Dorcoceras hygrometricum]